MGGKEAMTPKELEMYSNPDMQAFFREKMGPWQLLDPIFDTTYNQMGIITRIYPSIYYMLSDGDEITQIVSTNHLLRLPLPIDPVNPERGLEGMLLSALDLHRSFGLRNWRLIVTTNGMNLYNFREETPTLALLRAIEAQIGGRK
jgi:hypothetical protein